MPPKQLTEAELQDLLVHVKVRVGPAFNEALQAELRIRARQLRAASEAASQAGRQIRNAEPSARVGARRDQRPYQQQDMRRLNMTSILSSIVFVTATLAFIFLVLVQPLLHNNIIELDLTEEATTIPIVQTVTSPADTTPLVKPTQGASPIEPTQTDTPSPTSTETETATPTATAPLMPTETTILTPTWTPPIGLSATPSAIPAPLVKVTCSWTQVTGYIELSAPFVRLTVSLASPTIQEIGSASAPVQPDGSYSVTVTYPEQSVGTRLIGGYGEWDGTSWLRPATTFGADCVTDE